MATVNFYLKESAKDRKGRIPIYLVVQHHGKKFAYYTEEKIHIEHWDHQRQRVSKGFRGARMVNDWLDTLEDRAMSMLRTFRMEGRQPDLTWMKQELAGMHTQQQKEEAQSLLDFFDQYQADHKHMQSEATQKVTATLRQNLRDFEAYANYVLSFDQIDYSFFHKFVNYLVEERKSSANTINKKINKLKTVLNYAVKLSRTDNVLFREFSYKRTPSDKVFLTQLELDRLLALNLLTHPRLEKVRDFFCFACFTGLRFGDLSTLRPSHLVEQKTESGKTYLAIKRVMQKTKELAYIPLVAGEPLAILKKYEGKYETCLPSISNQKTNEYIKEIGMMAGIDKEVVKAKYIGSERTEAYYPKYQLMGSHTARYTFINISLGKGMRPETIQSIVGHATIKQLMAYVRVYDPMKYEEMQRIWGSGAV